MKTERTLWTDAQREEFRVWHQERLAQLQYPIELVRELEHAREQWLATVRTK